LRTSLCVLMGTLLNIQVELLCHIAWTKGAVDGYWGNCDETHGLEPLYPQGRWNNKWKAVKDASSICKCCPTNLL
ncbi:hypothetical protein OS493_035201, partial [Desmophyllum pertusum]